MSRRAQGTQVGVRHSDLPDSVKLRYLWRTDGDGPLFSLNEMRRRYIGRVLQAVEGNQMKAAEILGISPAMLGRRMK